MADQTQDNQILGSVLNDELLGSQAEEEIIAGEGDDLVDALEGDDHVDAGLGTDTVYGGDGRDTLIGDGEASEEGQENLIENGSFQASSYDGAYGAPSGWTIGGTQNSGGLHNDANRATDGDQYYAMGGWSGQSGGTLSQTLDLQPGETYTLGFDAKVGYFGGPVSEEARLDILDANGDVIATETVKLEAANEVASPQLTFVASTEATTIRFTHTETSPSPGDFDLDNVSLVQGTERMGETLVGDPNTSGELLQNGAFEDASLDGANWTAHANMAGWQSDHSGIEGWADGHNGLKTDDGGDFVELDRHAGEVDNLYQDVQTEAGVAYTLTFDAAARDTAVGESVEIYWNGDLVETVTPEGSMEWQSFEITVTGTGGNDRIEFRELATEDDALGVLLNNASLKPADENDDRLEGQAGEDTIVGNVGDDLLVGGGASTEWELVDGKWVYHADRVSSEVDPYMVVDGSDDVITGGSGDDVLLGNAGDDSLFGGEGEDRINAGVGEDRAFGGVGDDVLNLEDGDDYAEGGTGADIVNAGDGDDVVYGDNALDNLLAENDPNAGTFAQHGSSGAWAESSDPDTGMPGLSQTVKTEAGQSYQFQFDLAANLAGGATQGAVEVYWNGELLETLEANSGVFETHTLEVVGNGDEGVLSIKNVPVDASSTNDGPEYNTDGPIWSYEKSVEVGGETVEVSAFAPGQAKLYQVIDGQLKVFDTEASEYLDAGPSTGLKINAIGFNVEDDLIYGIAKANGVDALGNEVSKKDLVMLDADGQAYRVGETPVGDYVGDFDDSGNLWTFQSSLDRITKIDVNDLDADGNPSVENIYLPKDFLAGRTYDIAFNADAEAFFAIEPPSQLGGAGKIHKIDVSNLDKAGVPEISTLEISGTLVDGEMASGMAKGAYGAVFMDGDGNLYAGLNRGDHDLDGSTEAQGGIYKINYDFVEGQAYAELMSESQSTGSNDGAADPRSIDPFADVDSAATVVLRQPELISLEGGDDDLRGGSGNDTMFGNAGDDIIHGGTGNDWLSGDQGDDRVFGGEGTDELSGGLGSDHLDGGSGDDTISGGEGHDKIYGGAGDDSIVGGAGDDVIYAGEGSDQIIGGSGDDKVYAGVGDDNISGGQGADTIDSGLGADTVDGGSGNDFIQGKDGNDTISGGAGADKIVGGSGDDTIHGGEGDDHIWGGQWWKDGASDTFVYSQGGGKDTIHDFEIENDQLDLSAYGLSFEDIQDRMIDHGWATEINLEGLDTSGAGDKILLKSVKADELDETNFLI
ncbi:MAG: DUF642 domain-containing protein [Pseudomonadota bacterium]